MYSKELRIGLLLCAFLPLLAGCGKQGDPAPPLRAIPAPTKDLAVSQQGGRLLFGFTYPTVTPAGLALEGILAVELWETARPATADGKVAPMDPREFTAASKERLKIEGADLSTATSGDRIVMDLPVPEVAAGTPLQARYFAVRTVGKSGDRSELSNQVSLLPKPAPPAPERFTATARTDGILVEWSLVTGAQGYNVYRRDAEERSHKRPLQSVGPTEQSWLDTSARFGKNYIYAVTALAQREPVIESAIGSEREVRYQDRFSPPPPVELVALAEPRRVRLVWRASDAEDLAGYVVYRKGPVGDFVRITAQPVQAAEYVDQAVAPRETYSYRVTAVDLTGNESEPGAEVRAAVP
ncbi:MAG TPA: hypothetical protein VNW71_23805 [Thermoanaerobaculia bacterium]|nr:hypothetical protein [Thermoanaerobaculia bacterium]